MWYENDYRRIFMDMHLNDTNEEYLSKLDVKNLAAHLKEADVSSFVIKAQSHVGLQYWPGKHGEMHATLKKRNLDYVGEMIDECHKNGINALLYFSQVYDNYAYKHHTMWHLKYISGFGSRTPFGLFSRYGLLCPNNKAYQKYCAEILTELAENYKFEGIFLDMPFWGGVCYCPSCQKRFFKETGKLIPIIRNPDKKIWIEYIHARQRWLHEFIENSTNAIKKVNPNISVEHNMAAIGLDWVTGNTEADFELSDYAGGDYYGGYAEQSFMCKYYNNVTKNKPFCYITSRCDPNLIFHTVSRDEEDMLIHAANALLHNGAFSICDAMNPDGTFTEKIYDGAIKNVFAATKPYEQYVSGNIKSDVAVWYNTSYKTNKNYIESPLAIAKILKEKNIAFDIIGSKNISETTAKVICINSVQEISDEEVLLLKDYLKRGGNLFVTGGFGGNDNFRELIGVRQTGFSKYAYTYISPKKCFENQMKTFDVQSPYPVESGAIESEIEDNEVEILATLTYPYTVRARNADFAAIHSDPPGIHTNIPAVTKVKRENGYVMWVASTLELTKAHNCRASVADMILSMIDDDKRQFSSNAPEFVEIIRWEKDGIDYLGAVNQQPVVPVYPIDDIYIYINEKIKSAQLITDNGKELSVSYKNNKSIIKIDRLDIFHIIRLEK